MTMAEEGDDPQILADSIHDPSKAPGEFTYSRLSRRPPSEVLSELNARVRKFSEGGFDGFIAATWLNRDVFAPDVALYIRAVDCVNGEQVNVRWRGKRSGLLKNKVKWVDGSGEGVDAD
jgi:hypothetical protein